MTLGDLCSGHIGRTIRITPGSPAQVVAGIRHYLVTGPDTKTPVRKTSVMLGATGAKGNDHLGEHIGDSTDTIVLGNG